MAHVCHECYSLVRNPFYVVNLAVCGNKSKIALSSLEYVVCRAEADRIMPHTTRKPGTQPVLYSIRKATGTEGGPDNAHVVQITSRDERHMYASIDVTYRILTKTARDILFKKLDFVEGGAEERPAEWAQKVYEFFQAEQSEFFESTK